MARKNERVSLLKVVDGDTVVIGAHNGLFSNKAKEERIRLYGIDAPESDQAGGHDATKHLKKLLGRNNAVWLERYETDRHGRTVGLLYPHKGKKLESYNWMMVRDGHAHAYMTAPEDRERFRAAQTEAKRKHRGIWKMEKSLVAPTAHRAGKRERTKRRERVRNWIILACGAAALGYLTLSNLGPIRATIESVTKGTGG